MKKRAQPPDAHTYTIILRGLAEHARDELSLKRALAVYHSMFAENSPVRPTIIHTNAMINVCARAKDMDALYGVAARLPNAGRNAADNYTYTTILNAIRNAASMDVRDESSQEKYTRRHRAGLQGRRMWAEVVEKWQGGDLQMDEFLTCAMGRLLLLGDHERDYDYILSLAEQTMGLARQAPRLGDPNRPTNLHAPRVREKQLQSIVSDEITPLMEEVSPQESPESMGEKAPGSEFNAPSSPGSMPLPYARPGPNTLSLLLEACIQMNAMRAAQDYWGLLTSPSGPYQITPDAENYHMYLRLLRVQRASKLALVLVQDMRQDLVPKGNRNMIQPKTFRIALSTCGVSIQVP